MRNLVLWNLAAVMCLLVRPHSSAPLLRSLLPVTQNPSEPAENETGTPFPDYENDQEFIEIEERVCIGTNSRLSGAGDHARHLETMRKRYENCTYVQGNLELIFLKPNDSISFLRQIREVTGYVLIFNVDREELLLPSLRIIRGRTLFENANDKSALWVAANRGLRVLGLPALKEIMNGEIRFSDNPHLCHVADSIDWQDIVADSKKQKIILDTHEFSNNLSCAKCSPICEGGLCWGPSSEMCQKRSKTNCAVQCNPGRCFGTGPAQCCHRDCVGGCYGPQETQCVACKNFDDEGKCVENCPVKMYDSERMVWVPSPNPKFAYGNVCVKECPAPFLRHDGGCVRSCPDGMIEQDNEESGAKECVPCDGPCPKKCQGFSSDSPKDGPMGINMLTKETLRNFLNCTTVEGSLLILSDSFKGVQHFSPVIQYATFHPPVTPADLEQLSTIKIVTGHIRIDGSHPDMTDLSFLRNLEVIHGRSLMNKNALMIIKNQYLTSLSLNSLKKIGTGGVQILENSELCYADSVDWKSMMAPNTVANVRKNKNAEACRAENKTCHSECSAAGCWGPGADQCLSCARYKDKNTCVESCAARPMLYDAGNRTCETCDEQCLDGCHGPGPDKCTRCRNVKDGPNCQSTCPVFKFKNAEGVCQKCSKVCSQDVGCTGPNSYLGEGGCRSCEFSSRSSQAESDLFNATKVECIAQTRCPPRSYGRNVQGADEGPLQYMRGKTICYACHDMCERCDGPSPTACPVCRFVKQNGECIGKCNNATHYQIGKECLACSPECSQRGCTGPLSTQCVSCKIYRDEVDGKMNCTSTCPVERPYTTRLEHQDKLDPSEAICVKDEPTDQKAKRLGFGLGLGLGIPVVALAVFLAYHFRSMKHRKRILQYQKQFLAIEESQPFTPTDNKPNTALIRFITENELRVGGLLGEGAFGCVYRGMWVPIKENKRIPVAIKVLKTQDGTASAAVDDLLEEAKVMASVKNEFLVPMVGICMASPIMLISQLLPLGCLLNYIKKNERNISSRSFLNWCTQIAKGMKYLEDRHMIHRDLALRNVLVQTPMWVKITDFGLAKMLDCTQSAYKAGSGKMPIKWLAPECITNSVYSHKTDTWAFGVTVWEILSYGEKPYKDITPSHLLEKLLEGSRLPMPPISTVEIQAILIKCWTLNPESRPNFTVLATEFGSMLRDPGRYLVIPGDQFLRLPDYTHEDEQRLVNDDSGPEELISAEEYTNPGMHRFDHNALRDHKYQNGHMANGHGSKSSQHSSAPTFTNVSAPIPSRGAWSMDRQDSPPHSRYAHDPVKGIYKYGEAQAVPPRKQSEARLGPDGYLQPIDLLPAEVAYLEIADSVKERDALLEAEYRQMPLHSRRAEARRASQPFAAYPGGARMVHNPEYNLISSGASNALLQ
ncbi:hypothetical protein RvY_00994-2 [Ramazzottius varieornatus]|uniref:Receptor protein-tyrosine kinase n=1 Tax=Ramazzottius varieornatus TaxID=947166 RepID=A0A1D1ULX5_RAMVA|nr:hypothetical protein RvY_00994-2 [Ramazzottius varieornatus]